MDIDKVRALSDAELDQALVDAKQDLWQARFALSTRQLKDYSSIPQTRRTIARILTAQRQRADPAARTAGGARDDRISYPGAGQAEDQGRPRRQRQDGQDDRRVRRAAGAP